MRGFITKLGRRAIRRMSRAMNAGERYVFEVPNRESAIDLLEETGDRMAHEITSTMIGVGEFRIVGQPAFAFRFPIPNANGLGLVFVVVLPCPVKPSKYRPLPKPRYA